MYLHTEAIPCGIICIKKKHLASVLYDFPSNSVLHFYHISIPSCFTLNENTGELYVSIAALINYEVLTSYHDTKKSGDQYIRVIVSDIKNNLILEDYSLNPVNFSNYFQKSDLPFEISPIFFNAEVLDKYKQNHDKYEVNECSISCRGGWHLETYDINEYNQVHTYAIYLSRLPYKEQRHWENYNERPNGTISARAHTTDFQGNFPEEMSKFEKLKVSLEKLGKIKFSNDITPVWEAKGGWDNASKGLHYLKTENSNLYHDFIISLANTVNEGFKKTPLEKIAAHYGYDKKTTLQDTS